MLEGNPTLRHPEGSDRLEPWDVVFFQKGPEGAHGIRNETEETVRVLMFSTVVIPTATVYPDSDKVGIWTGDPETDVIVRRESKRRLLRRRGLSRSLPSPLGVAAISITRATIALLK